jgi:mono/diheme cytochrome c family protein
MRLIRVSVAIFCLLLVAACGTPAPQASELPPTFALPSRVPVQPTAGGSTNTPAPAVAAQPTRPPTLAPTRIVIQATPTITLIPTKAPPTATIPVTPTDDPAAERGRVLFQNGTGEEGVPTCASCHYVDKPDAFTGPSMLGVALRAARRVPGQNAGTYIRNSILNPNVHLVPNEKDAEGIERIYAVGGQSLMYQQYAQKLTPEQVTELVAYLLTLR